MMDVLYEPNSSSNSGYDTQIRSAVNDTAGEFLQYIYSCPSGTCHAVDAEFGSDAVDQTTTEPANPTKPYLKGVSDPISRNGSAVPDACKATNNSNLTGRYAGLLDGMSQRGAIR